MTRTLRLGASTCEAEYYFSGVRVNSRGLRAEMRTPFAVDRRNLALYWAAAVPVINVWPAFLFCLADRLFHLSIFSLISLVHFTVSPPKIEPHVPLLPLAAIRF